MIELLKRLNQIDLKDLFKKPNSGSINPNQDSASKGAGIDSASINFNLENAPKGILFVLGLACLLILYACFKGYKLYDSHSELSNTELMWAQSQQQYILASQQLETKLADNRKLLKETDLYINSKSEFQKNIYTFHKTAGLEIVKTNEDEENGKKYFNFISQGNFKGIQAVLQEIRSLTLFSTVNMVSITVLPEKGLLEFHLQIDYTDISPLKPYFGTRKLSHQDGVYRFGSGVSVQRIQFVPLKKQEASPGSTKINELEPRDPFFSPQVTKDTPNPVVQKAEIQQAPPSNGDQASGNPVAEKSGIFLRGCMIASVTAFCIYELPNKSTVIKSNGQDIVEGLTQISVDASGATIKRAKTIQNISIGEQFNE